MSVEIICGFWSPFAELFSSFGFHLKIACGSCFVLFLALNWRDSFRLKLPKKFFWILLLTLHKWRWKWSYLTFLALPNRNGLQLLRGFFNFNWMHHWIRLDNKEDQFSPHGHHERNSVQISTWTIFYSNWTIGSNVFRITSVKSDVISVIIQTRAPEQTFVL